MNETDFQAIYEDYARCNPVTARSSDADSKETGINKAKFELPQKLHLLLYNYARMRHQQSSDVAADFYLYILPRLEILFDRYTSNRHIPFIAFFSSCINFEFRHFLRRRKLPRKTEEIQSLEAMQERNADISPLEDMTPDLKAIFRSLKPLDRIWSKLALGYALAFAELRSILPEDRVAAWAQLRAYRDYLKFIRLKQEKFLRQRDLQAKKMLLVDHALKTPHGKLSRTRLLQRKQKILVKYFTFDTRIPLRMLAPVTGASLATIQRQTKKAVARLKEAYIVTVTGD